MFGVVSEKVYVSKTGVFCVIFGLFVSNFFVLENIFSSIFLKQGNSYEVTANISESEIRFNRKSQIISKLKQRERRKERKCFRNKYNTNFLFELLLLIAIEL